MAAQTPEVSSRLMDFRSGPVLLQPSSFPSLQGGVEQQRGTWTGELCPLQRLQMPEQLKADPHVLERGSPDSPA